MKITLSKHVVVLLAVAGTFLAALSLSLPWYKLDFTGYTDLVEGGFYKARYVCYPDFFVFDDLGYHTGPGYQPWHGGISEYRTLMHLEWLLVACSGLASILFAGAVLYSRRSAAMVLGALASGTAIMASVYFAMSVNNAISIYDSTMSAPPIPDSFAGSGSDVDGNDWSWGPASGWLLLTVTACLMSATAVAERFRSRKEIASTSAAPAHE